MIVGDVVEVVANRPQHVLRTIILKQFQQLDHGTGIDLESRNTTSPRQTWARAFADQAPHVFTGISRPDPQLVQGLRIALNKRSDAELGSEHLRERVLSSDRLLVCGQAMGGDERRMREVSETQRRTHTRAHLPHRHARIGIEVPRHHVRNPRSARHQPEIVETIEAFGDEHLAVDR